MASEIKINLSCEQHLIRFFETLYGPSPILFPKNSNFNTILDVFLDKPPLGYVEPNNCENTLTIQLPFLENKNVISNFYLSPTKKRIFVKELEKYFKITFRSEISKHIVLGLDRQDSIQIFIEKYNLSQDECDMLEKDFQRYLKLRCYHRLFRNKTNSSVKGHDCLVTSQT